MTRTLRRRFWIDAPNLGMEFPEEAHVTMRDLGLGLADVGSSLEAEAATVRSIASFATSGSRVYSKAFRSELWLNNLALKREAMRYGALCYFAVKEKEGGPPTEAEIEDAKRTILPADGKGAMAGGLPRARGTRGERR